ncbi:MAG TPA: DUF1015 domain-containing protein [Terriglobia bacterium]|nr:DUF1015 domain-containing protein [Terriglobia bacterium]
MAEILPFRALHYDAQAVSGLGKVVTQPYDKISPEMQARYYSLSPYNLVRVIRGRQTEGDTPADNVYTHAARDFRDWIDTRVLAAEREPALYPYYQEYSVPGLASGDGQTGAKKVRRGFIGLCRLEDYSARVVHRHEETLSGPKADRLELLKATRAHFGQIFLLYSDPEGEIERAFERATAGKPWEQVEDEYGTVHSVWRLGDADAVERIVEAMQVKKLVIADGHHRYETALAYRDWCRAQGLTDGRAEYVMATFIRMETDGLTILPTHRVVFGLPAFDWTNFQRAVQSTFEVEDIADGSASFQKRLAEAGRGGTAIGTYAGPGKAALLRRRNNTDLARLLPELPASLARLDVVILHRILLERILGIDPQAVREERNLRYMREFDAAIAEVDSGRAQAAFLMNPTPIEAVRDNAFAGCVLPQKSTDFYPKLLSGLTIYWLDNPAGI